MTDDPDSYYDDYESFRIPPHHHEQPQRLLRSLWRAVHSQFTKMKLTVKTMFSNTPKIELTLLELTGVYFLKRKGQIIYIGKSTNVLARAFSSKHASKQFDEVVIHTMPHTQLADYERDQIALHKPHFNDWNGERKRTNNALARRCTAPHAARGLEYSPVDSAGAARSTREP